MNNNLTAWKNALFLNSGPDVAEGDRPTSGQIAIVYGVVGFLVSRVLG